MRDPQCLLTEVKKCCAADYVVVGCDNLLLCALAAGVTAGTYFHACPFSASPSMTGLYAAADAAIHGADPMRSVLSALRRC